MKHAESIWRALINKGLTQNCLKSTKLDVLKLLANEMSPFLSILSLGETQKCAKCGRMPYKQCHQFLEKLKQCTRNYTQLIDIFLS